MFMMVNSLTPCGRGRSGIFKGSCRAPKRHTMRRVPYLPSYTYRTYVNCILH